ncbi:MAG TPA: carboxypeptidase regulatory-like domain-containing protein, partial [Gemmatirosa sp.]
PAGAAWVITDGRTRVRLAHAAGTLAKTTDDGSAVVALPPGRYLVRVALPSPAADVEPPVTAVRVTPDARAALTVAVPTLASLTARCPAPVRADTGTRTRADSSATRLVYGTVVDERAWAAWAPAASARDAGRAIPGVDTAAPAVGGARVRAVWADGATGRNASGSAQATTDSEGRFVLCEVPRAATPRITAEAPDGPSASWSVALGPASWAAASTRVALWPSATRAAASGPPAPPTDPFTVVVDRAVSGVVYDSLRHRPLPGAAVQLARAGDLLGRRAVVADSAGAFRIDALAPGRYLVGFDDPLLDLLHVDVPPRLVELGPGRDAVRVDLGLPTFAALRPALCGSGQAPNDSTGVLAGRVRDAADGAPVARATVVFTWSELAIGAGRVHRERRRVSVPTGPGGTYVACGVPAGVELAASASAPERASGEVGVEVPPRGFAVRDLSLGDTATVAVARGTARLTGTVRDPAGRPVRAARAFVWGTGATATAGEDGTFALAGLTAGTRTLEVRAIGFAPRRVAVDLAPGQPAATDVRLERVATLAPETVYGIPSTPSLRLREFLDRRRRASFGRFLTAADVEHRAEVSDALRGLAGMQVVPDPRFGNAILGRGRRPGPCRADVILDGTPLQADDVLDRFVGPQQVAGIEVYPDATYAPLEYGGGHRSGCSVVLVWTR